MHRSRFSFLRLIILAVALHSHIASFLVSALVHPSRDATRRDRTRCDTLRCCREFRWEGRRRGNINLSHFPWGWHGVATRTPASRQPASNRERRTNDNNNPPPPSSGIFQKWLLASVDQQRPPSYDPPQAHRLARKAAARELSKSRLPHSKIFPCAISRTCLSLRNVQLNRTFQLQSLISTRVFRIIFNTWFYSREKCCNKNYKTFVIQLILLDMEIVVLGIFHSRSAKSRFSLEKCPSNRNVDS